MKQTDQPTGYTAGTDRRTLLRTLSVTAFAGLAGCLGDEGGDTESSDDVADGTEETTDDSRETVDDRTEDEEPVDDDTTDAVSDIRPSEIALEPSDAWDDDHPDVEIPDEPGRAVLTVDGRRVEMVGDLSGGPIYSLYEAVAEDDDFAGDGTYFLADGLFEPTDEALAEQGWESGHQLRFLRRMVGWSGNSLSYRNSDSISLGWPNLLMAATYSYREEVDGSTGDGSLVGTTYAEEPFLRVDRTGVVTATGTVEDPGNSDIPEGATFEFGARAQEGWAEQWEED